MLFCSLPRCVQVREELMSRKYEVIVTSYEVISIERAALRKFKWEYVVCSFCVLLFVLLCLTRPCSPAQLHCN